MKGRKKSEIYVSRWKKVKNIKLCRIKIEKVKGLRNGKVKFETEFGGVRLCQALELITFFFRGKRQSGWREENIIY